MMTKVKKETLSFAIVHEEFSVSRAGEVRSCHVARPREMLIEFTPQLSLLEVDCSVLLSFFLVDCSQLSIFS